ncbi:MAG: prepilin-type N-terminal cleavage/methylation domain-containing protein [Eubacteriales bacterium]|nr:prepilin-type N-terminal cleavage/methylation domain-containing protein [Eubacteriales bacterium]MDD4327545.1 prepilin-type N-terminal cleavage/methylation domain-containing protein [Eubacteriales bacterium]
MKKRNTRKGFTLIELIVVIAILAILAAVAVPSFIGITDRANTQVEVTTAQMYASAINIHNNFNPDSKIADAAVGDLDEDAIADLGDLMPTSDYKNVGEDTALDTKILARIAVVDGIASVDNKEKIG